ncbi:MAG: DUF6364 family protein [Terrimicrobiaceae bacterium]|nr:DUF6364 family protein [Terrimicrobiaceae bacterium]
MKTRVTITLDPAAHQRAKRTARARKTSVSGLIESLLQSAAAPGSSSLVDQMTGSASLRFSAEGSDPLYDALHSKYLEP